MKNAVQMHRWKEAVTECFSPRLIYMVLALLVVLLLGVAIGATNPVYGLALAGAIVMVIIALLRLDGLMITLIIAVHLYLDWYIGLHLVGILMALILLFAYYLERSPDHPWIGPRPLWLWILFLTLTIYPAINGGQFLVYDAATFYPSLVLGAFIMFWLGSIIAKDISAVQRIFHLLSAFATLIAIHTIIEATTGVFLFESAKVDAHLVQVANYDIIGTTASRAISFFLDPNWNGCFLVTMFFLPLSLFIGSKSLLTKLIFVGEMAVILVALLFTYSNGSWIALLSGIVVFVFWVGSQRYRVLWVIMMILMAAGILVLFPSQLAVQLQHASAPGELLLRQGAWQTAIRVIEAYPLFGVGLGGQAYLIRANPYRVPTQFLPLNHPHDAYLQWGAMAGIPVLLVFLLLLGYAFWRSWHNWRAIDIRYRPLLGGGITALIALSINSVSIDGWTNAVIATIGWLIFGMLTSPLLLRDGHSSKRQEKQLNRPGESLKTKVYIKD